MFLFSHALHMPYQSDPFCPTNIWWRVQIMEFLNNRSPNFQNSFLNFKQ
jgi:hypothetical protein